MNIVSFAINIKITSESMWGICMGGMKLSTEIRSEPDRMSMTVLSLPVCK